MQMLLWRVLRLRVLLFQLMTSSKLRQRFQMRSLKTQLVELEKYIFHHITVDEAD